MFKHMMILAALAASSGCALGQPYGTPTFRDQLMNTIYDLRTLKPPRIWGSLTPVDGVAPNH